jgi:Transposase and inactivated derivatives, IS30 family
MKIITEEMKYRQKMCEYAKKRGVTKAARRYHTNRKFVYRQLKKYDGTVKSLALKSRRPKSNPNAHRKEEVELLKQIKHYYGFDGQAEMYVQAKKRGYKRSYDSMCRQLRKIREKKQKRTKTSYTKHIEVRGKYPGEKVQVDIKYVPEKCIGFESYGKKYYQITAIDEYSRKRILAVVDEKTVTNTSKFLKNLEERMCFIIKTIQTDNGSEFVNNSEESHKETMFEITLKELGIKHKRTKPYSPWQNGKVERSHRIDGKKFYSRNKFTSYKDMVKKLTRYNTRYNNIAKKVLDFLSPNQMVEQYVA